MKIIVTGSSGFIGSALADRLEREGHDVYGLTRYMASDSRYDYYQLKRKLICDVRAGDRVRAIVEEVKPDVVFHLAAITPVSYSFLSPETAREVVEVNFIGTMNIAEACMKYKVPHLVHASTSEFYGEQKDFPIQEDATPHPLSPYAVAKLAAEEYIRYLARTEGLPYTIIRPYNTYGRAFVRKPYFVVERAITQALLERHIHLYTPNPIRDLLDRDSHVDAYVRCLGNERAKGEDFNIGLGKGYTIGEMAEIVAREVEKVTGKHIPISWDMAPDRPYDIACLICSNEKARRILNWRPLCTLEEGIAKAVREWKGVLGV